MDRFLLISQVALAVFGIVGVSMGAPELWQEHSIRVGVALLLTLAVALVSPRVVVRFSPFIYFSVLTLLVLVLFIGASPDGSESHRWLLIGGFSLQPSELMKVAVIAYLSAFFYNHLGNWNLWRPMLIIGLAVGLIILEPDVSTSLFVFALAITIMVAAGTTVLRVITVGAIAALIAFMLVGGYLGQYDYLGQRFEAYLDLWQGKEHVSSISYQPWRAQQVLRKAGIFGEGTGRPLYSMPEAETDMVAISIGWSLGLLGIVSMFAFYFVIAWRGLQIASILEGPGALICVGATTYICGQAALNLLVATGLFPVTGIPLPFVSYGMNSLISIAIAFGFLQSGYRQAKRQGVLI